LRNIEYEQHIRDTVANYDGEQRAALRTLLRTRNTNNDFSSALRPLTDHGLIEFPKDGPGSVKEELRDILRRSPWSSRDGSEATSGRHRLGSEVAAGWRP
jgi:hypothetical protein